MLSFPPMRDTVQVWTRIPPQTIRLFDRVAKRQGVTRSQMIAQLITQAIHADAQARIAAHEGRTR